ncbi:MAG: hypothetical protein ACFBSE_25080 [Prochloraceae cyanobacterium]
MENKNNQNSSESTNLDLDEELLKELENQDLAKFSKLHGRATTDPSPPKQNKLELNQKNKKDNSKSTK